MFASLLYLPHGVRVLAAWFLGWRSVPVLFVASVVGHLAIYQTRTPELIVTSSLSSALCASLAMQIVLLAAPSVTAAQNERGTWRVLLLIALLSSGFNTVGQVVALVVSGRQINFASLFDLGHVFNFALGDVAGMVAVFAGLTLAFRWSRPSV